MTARMKKRSAGGRIKGWRRVASVSRAAGFRLSRPQAHCESLEAIAGNIYEGERVRCQRASR